MITHPPPQIPMETLRRKRKNFNKIELLPKRWGLPGNTSSWLVLQSFHPPMAGFFLSPNHFSHHQDLHLGFKFKSILTTKNHLDTTNLRAILHQNYL
ncbi:hypothetical protein CF109_18615 [Aeromonas veronii]|nr:hypothetical protein AVS_04875 [Aeromonas veronii bv. sobria]TNI70624.1 hypothetical protein CF109_18615 [Aeromonas veronii]